MSGTFHNGSIDSPAKQRILAYLRSCGYSGATTSQIGDGAHVENVATWISMIRDNGIPIMRRYEGQNEFGSKIHRYFAPGFEPREEEAAA